MTPAFTPEDKDYGAPKVVLAAVGPKMTEVVGEVADGMIIHPFSTLPYINSVTLPAIEQGLAKAGKTRKDFELSYSHFVVTGAMKLSLLRVRKRPKSASLFMVLHLHTRAF